MFTYVGHPKPDSVSVLKIKLDIPDAESCWMGYRATANVTVITKPHMN